jgi:two-component system NarL family sensor kinase
VNLVEITVVMKQRREKWRASWQAREDVPAEPGRILLTRDVRPRHTRRMTTWSDTALRRWAMAGFALVTVLAIVNPVLGQGVAGRPGLSSDGVIDYGDSVFCLLVGTSALLILWFRPRHSVGWILMLMGLLEDTCVFWQTYGARSVAFPDEHLPLGRLALQLSGGLWVPVVFLPVTVLMLRYPSGGVRGRWSRRFDRAAIAGLVLVYIGYAGSESGVKDVAPDLDRVITPPLPLCAGLMFTGAVLVLSAVAFTLVNTFVRAMRAGYPERQQLTWLVTLAPVAVFVLFLPYEGLQRLLYGIPLAIVVGVLRYRLAGIEVVVRRTLLYGTLTGLVLLVFVAVTATLSSVLPSGALPQVLAAGLVAVGVVPLRDRLQRLVDRFVYGDRGDPLAALTRLGTPVGRSADEALLPEVLSGVASALRVPGAEIIGTAGTHAVVGFAGEGMVEVPLVMGGETVGVLRLAPRAGEVQLPAADRRLVEGLAPLLAAVLHAVELAEALRVEQERVVVATETERARLRQELHDGLGPSLTGIGLGLEALEQRVGGSDLVERLRAETSSSLEEVRRIIDGLRPGALESADLLALLKIRADHLSTTSALRVRVAAPERLPVLPDDVEVAALRIVEEALTNVVRHAGATTCCVSLRLDDALRLEVRDDGRGYDGPRYGGVGVDSMRVRAERLGGTCEVAATPDGTVVTAVLPLVPQAVSGMAS